MKQILGAGIVILCLLVGIGDAAIYERNDAGSFSGSSAGNTWYRMDAGGAPYTYYYTISASQTSSKYITCRAQVLDQVDGWVTAGSKSLTPSRMSIHISGSYSGSGLQADPYYGHSTHIHVERFGSQNTWKYSFQQMIVSGQNYTINGDLGCVAEINMYIYNNSMWKQIVNASDVTGDVSYSYDITDGYEYRIYFDTDMYEFEVNGSDIEYNADMCTQHTFHFKELCNNSIANTDGYYAEYLNGAWGLPQFFTASTGTLSISNSSATAIQLFTTPFSGIAGWVIDPIVTDGVYEVVNPNINWWLKVKVLDDNTSLPLPGAHVSINQSCYATSGIFTNHKNTGANGLVSYDGMSLSNAALHVTKDGYKFLDDNSTGFQATLSGREGFSGKTWVIRLAPSDSENESSWSEVNGSTYIYFKDITGNKTSRVSDSDANVYLYYENNNSDEESMTLKFQSSSTHTYFSDELSWTIPHNEAGYKTIANSYFTPASYSYRAILYNSTIYGWNITKPLSVLTGAQETIYGNLTTALWFSRASGGKIDFREDMKIVSHACSNNTTLMNVDVELWKDGAYLAHTNLTATDFLTASFKYYDTWNPVFDYVSGSNYSIRMYGFDRTLLETDYVECYTDTVTRRNKLTIMVKSQSGGNLCNSFVFLEGWGQLETGSNYYNSYEGLENGTYRYKASKSGYDGAGWDEIVIADGDETVTYVLTSQTSAASHASAKMSDSDVKEIFFPCMFALLIFIVLGGFKYVLK